MYPFILDYRNYTACQFKKSSLYFHKKSGYLIALHIGNTLYYNNKYKRFTKTITEILALYQDSNVTYKPLNSLDILCKLANEHFNQ